MIGGPGINQIIQISSRIEVNLRFLIPTVMALSGIHSARKSSPPQERVKSLRCLAMAIIFAVLWNEH